MALTNQLYHTSIKIGEDAQTQIDFETADEIHFDVDGTQALRLDSSQIATFASNLSIAASKTSPNVSIGGSSATTAVIELIAEGTSGTSFIDFHAEGAPADYALRVQRFTGANGSARIDNKGTGDIQFYTDGTEALRIDGSQNTLIADDNGLVVGHDSQLTIASVIPEFQVLGTGDGTDSAMAIGRWGGGSGGRINLVHSRAAIGSNTVTNNGDEIGVLNFIPDNGTNLNTVASSIKVVHNGTFSTVVPTDLILSTSSSSSANVEAARINSSQQILASTNGSVSAPAIAWYGDEDTGVYRIDSDIVGIATGGVEGFRVTGSQNIQTPGSVFAGDGNLTTTAYGFASEANTGMYLVSTDTLGLATNGVLALKLDSSQNATFAGNITVSEDGKIDFSNTAPGTSGDATGVIFSFTAGATLAVGDVVYMGTGGKVLLADADAATSMPALGICTSASTDTNPVDVMVQGVMKLTGWSFTIGNDIFVSTTAGDVTATAPSGTGDTVQKVGVATASDAAYFNFNTTEVVLA